MKNIGKIKYEQIEIPDNLNQVVAEAIERGNKLNRKRRLQQWVASAAAVVLFFFAGANIAPVYAYVSEIPVIGMLVQKLHIGTGGERTDGVYTDAQIQGEEVVFQFSNDDVQMETAPVYTIEYLQAPERIILTLYGVRGMNFAAITERLMATDAVQDVYRCMIGDDSAYGMGIVLNPGYTYVFTERENPASLAVCFSHKEQAETTERIYYLRSEAMPYGEGIGMLAEQYWEEGASQLKTKNGEYIITIGQYETKEEAEDALRTLEEKMGGKTDLFVSSGATDEIPEK